MNKENNRLNFFCSLAEMDMLHKTMDLDPSEAYIDSSFTVDVIDFPFLLFYSSNKDSCSLQINIRFDHYRHEEENGIKEAQISAPRGGGMQGQASDNVQQVVAPFMIFCMKLAKYLKGNRLDQKYPDLDPEEAGILLEAKEQTVEYRKVSGDDRPDMMCRKLSGEVKMMRPYDTDLKKRLLLEMLPLEAKEKAAESGNVEMIKHLFDYYMGNADNPHAELKKSVDRMEKVFGEVTGQRGKNTLEEQEEDTQNPKKAFYWLKKLAEKGDAAAIRLLSTFYAKGFGTERNFDEAVRWLEQLPKEERANQPIDLYKESAQLQRRVEAGEIDAQKKYGFNLSMLGRLVPEIGQDTDYAEAFKLIKMSAARNDLEAIDLLSKYYEYGIGVPKDEIKAFRLCERAAIQGYMESQEKLARLYFEGKGTEKNTEAAISWAKKAADQGDLWAMKTLINIYINKEGGRDDLIEAEKWAQKAADLGDEEAKAALQNLKETKEGKLVSFRDALAGAEKGNPAAQCLVGSYYACGYQTERDLPQALYWMKKAASAGREDAQSFVEGFKNIEEVERKAADGDPQAIGELAKKYIALSNAYNYEKQKTIADGLQFAQRAARMGNAIGQYVLGHCYENGIGLEKNDGKAFELYSMSAEQEFADAELALANLYLLGKGTNADPDAAVACLDKAVQHGNPDAEKTREMYPQILLNVGLDKMGDGANTGGRDPELGVRFVKKAAEIGHGQGQFALGMLYLNGKQVEQDFENAMVWLKKASESGYQQAADVIAKFDKPEAYNNAANREFMRKDKFPDKEKVFRLMKHAAESGLAASQSTLGILYMNGVGVAPDYKKGMEWLQKAADQGHERAASDLKKFRLPDDMFRVATIMLAYNKKNGLDSADARDLLEKAAEAGSAEANNLIGLFYAAPKSAEAKFGVLLEKNQDKAKHFFEKALELKPDLSQAGNNLKKLTAEREAEKNGTPAPSELKWALALPFKKKTSSNENG